MRKGAQVVVWQENSKQFHGHSNLHVLDILQFWYFKYFEKYFKKYFDNFVYCSTLQVPQKLFAHKYHFQVLYLVLRSTQYLVVLSTQYLLQQYLVLRSTQYLVAYILKPTGIMMKTIAKMRFCYIPKGGSQFLRTNLLSKK